MLPGRFTDRKEKAQYEAFTRPFIDEMGKSTGDNDEDYAYDTISF